jgi:hypothetical protein
MTIFTAMDPTFLSVKYPAPLWSGTLLESQVNTSINAGAQIGLKIVTDMQGAAAWQSQKQGANIPNVGLSLSGITYPLAASAVGATLTNEDMRQYAFGGLGNLPQNLQKAEIIALNNLVESTFFYGDASVGFIGYLSYTGITYGNVAATGTGNSTTWALKTPYQIWYDLNEIVTTLYTASNTLFVADLVEVPPAEFALLQQPMTIGGAVVSESILDYFTKHNMSTAMGKKLEVRSNRYLTGAGAGAHDRMVAIDRNPEHQEMAFPLQPVQQAPVPAALGYSFASEQKHGSFAVYQPASMLYRDYIG